jgi:hypothetical protein
LSPKRKRHGRRNTKAWRPVRQQRTQGTKMTIMRPFDGGVQPDHDPARSNAYLSHNGGNPIHSFPTPSKLRKRDNVRCLAISGNGMLWQRKAAAMRRALRNQVSSSSERRWVYMLPCMNLYWSLLRYRYTLEGKGRVVVPLNRNRNTDRNGYFS